MNSIIFGLVSALYIFIFVLLFQLSLKRCDVRDKKYKISSIIMAGIVIFAFWPAILIWSLIEEVSNVIDK